MGEAIVCEKTLAYGNQRYRVNKDGVWQVLMFGSWGPNDPPVGLSWKWGYIPKDRVPKKVREASYDF